MQLIVATIGSAHGLKGEVKLDVRTDEPQSRFAPGNLLETDPGDAGPLTVLRARQAPNGFFVLFAQARDRSQAEALRGIDLVVESDEQDADPDAWYPHDLIDMAVRHVDGRELGAVTGLESTPAHDLLVVCEPDGAEALVPFVSEIVTDIDEEESVVTVDPPRGLFAADPIPAAERSIAEGAEPGAAS